MRRWAEDALPVSGRRITDHAMRMRIKERYEAGETCGEIADALGLHRSTVRNVLVSLGVQMDPLRRPKQRKASGNG